MHLSGMTVVRKDPSAFIAKGPAAGEKQGFDPFDQVFDYEHHWFSPFLNSQTRTVRFARAPDKRHCFTRRVSFCYIRPWLADCHHSML